MLTTFFKKKQTNENKTTTKKGGVGWCVGGGGGAGGGGPTTTTPNQPPPSTPPDSTPRPTPREAELLALAPTTKETRTAVPTRMHRAVSAVRLHRSRRGGHVGKHLQRVGDDMSEGVLDVTDKPTRKRLVRSRMIKP